MPGDWRVRWFGNPPVRVGLPRTIVGSGCERGNRRWRCCRDGSRRWRCCRDGSRRWRCCRDGSRRWRCCRDGSCRWRCCRDGSRRWRCCRDGSRRWRCRWGGDRRWHRCRDGNRRCRRCCCWDGSRPIDCSRCRRVCWQRSRGGLWLNAARAHNDSDRYVQQSSAHHPLGSQMQVEGRMQSPLYSAPSPLDYYSMPLKRRPRSTDSPDCLYLHGHAISSAR